MPDDHDDSLQKGLRLAPGDIVRNFKRETMDAPRSHYLYRILHFAILSESGAAHVVYLAAAQLRLYCAKCFKKSGGKGADLLWARS